MYIHIHACPSRDVHVCSYRCSVNQPVSDNKDQTPQNFPALWSTKYAALKEQSILRKACGMTKLDKRAYTQKSCKFLVQMKRRMFRKFIDAAINSWPLNIAVRTQFRETLNIIEIKACMCTICLSGGNFITNQLYISFELVSIMLFT